MKQLVGFCVSLLLFPRNFCWPEKGLKKKHQEYPWWFQRSFPGTKVCVGGGGGIDWFFVADFLGQGFVCVGFVILTKDQN